MCVCVCVCVLCMHGFILKYVSRFLLLLPAFLKEI